ncbi:MAG: lipid-A-disaccharide synthase [candidate division WOR-3 bacterium]
MKVLLIAGEVSGDLHASNLITSLRKINPKIEFYGVGGERMEKTGAKIIYPSSKISIVGFTEVFSKILNLREARRAIYLFLKRNKIDFAITVDFPGFNIQIARYLKSKKIPVFYFIPPQVWAWGRWRVKSLSKYFKHLFVLYPFEKEFFEKEGLKSSFLGNPLMDIVKIDKSSKREKEYHSEILIAILPGSRETEIKRLLIPMLRAFRIFRKKYPQSKGIVSLYTKEHLPLVLELTRGTLEDVEVLYGKTYEIFKDVDLALIASGTAAVEAALFQIPMVVMYRLSYLSWIISKFLVKVKNFSLVNILLSRKVVPELIQKEVNPLRISKEMEIVYENKEKIKEELKKIPKMLGNRGVYDRIASKIISMV